MERSAIILAVWQVRVLAVYRKGQAAYRIGRKAGSDAIE